MIRFTKMHGLGNDFVVIDAINQVVSLSPEIIRQLGDRHFGIGFDQLLMVEKPISANAEFKYRIFNADGSEVGQCGNGARCFARFVRDKGLTSNDEIRVDTESGQLLLKLADNGMVTVDMGIPRHRPEEIPLLAESESDYYDAEVENGCYRFGAVSMGNPHAVLEVADVSSAPVSSIGRLLESHPRFPARANIGFMEIVDHGRIKLRVYERGAQETLACGSGACAAAVVAIDRGLVGPQVSVQLPGGELTIQWAGRGRPVFMTGPAATVFDGTIDL